MSLEKKENYQESGEKKLSKKRLVIGIVGALLLMILALFSIIIIEPFIKYNKGKRYFDNANYSEAMNVFDELGNYKDANEMSKKSAEMIEVKKQYNKGIYDYEKGNVKAALEVFENIQYGDSADYLEKCQNALYEKGQYYIQNKKYDQAEETFELIKEYKDSKDQLNKVKTIKIKIEKTKRNEESVKLAKQDIGNDKYLNAIEKLDSIRGYDNKDELLELYDQCYYGMALSRYESGNLDEAKKYIDKVTQKNDNVNSISKKIDEFISLYDSWLGKWQYSSGNKYDYWLTASTGEEKKLIAKTKYGDRFEDTELTDDIFLFHSDTYGASEWHEIKLTAEGSGILTTYFKQEDGSLKKVSERKIHRISKEIG